MDQDDRHDLEIERRLRAYADAHLAPDPASMVRMRAAVLAVAAGEPGTVSLVSPSALQPPQPIDRKSLRSLGHGRLRGRNPVPVFRSDEPLEAISETPFQASEALPREDWAGSLPRVRRAELIPVVEPAQPVQAGRWVRRGVAVLLAAGLLLGGAVAVSAAPPDSPLYDTRILLENLTLPAAASARAEARVAALQERIKEAKGAANGKNGKAVAAALKAYRASVKDALKEAGDDPDALAALYAAIGVHLEVLQTIDTDGVGEAEGAIENALEDSQNAVTEIENRGHGKPAGTPGRGPKG
jgi:hypothetical protein